MSYQLIYWPIPFRGNFIRLLLEVAEQPYTDANFSEVKNWKDLPIADQTLPAMAPPHLVDEGSGKSYGQLPVIMMYLAEQHGLLPEDEYLKQLCLKMLLDANDILLEITRFHGMTMWNKKDWKEFRTHRLQRWMQIFEQTLIKFGRPDSPYFFGETMTLADITAYALWGTMITRLLELKPDLESTAKGIYRIVNTIAQHPRIIEFEQKQQEDYGLMYCAGKIEKSLREMLEE